MTACTQRCIACDSDSIITHPNPAQPPADCKEVTTPSGSTVNGPARSSHVPETHSALSFSDQGKLLGGGGGETSKKNKSFPVQDDLQFQRL